MRCGEYEAACRPELNQFGDSVCRRGSGPISQRIIDSANAVARRLSQSLRSWQRSAPRASTQQIEVRWSRLTSLLRLRFEIVVLLMLVSTFLALRFSDPLLTKTIEFTPHDSSNYTPYLYSDQVQGGRSRSAADPEHLLAWTCDIRKGVEFPFCGYELLFDGQRATNGFDLSDFESLSMDFTYFGPTDLLRLSLKNFDPRYSEAGQRDTAKFNKVDIIPHQGRQKVNLHLSEFGVAEWWLVFRKIPPGLSKPQFDNVVSLDIGPTYTSKPGLHRIRVHGISLKGRIMPEAQWYLLILGCWIVVMAAYLIHRALNYRREVAETHQRQLEETRRLKASKAAAEKASRAKSEFLSGMSHELRTPLNAILGYTQLLKREELTERQAAAIATIHNSGTHLLALITDVLDLAKVEAGRLELCPAPFDLASLIRDVGSMMKASADQRGLTFRCDLPRNLPAAVVGDEKRLRQVLLNLLGNAIKFTSQGQVALQTSLMTSVNGKAQIRFLVSDTGPGIAPDLLKAIFKPFEQVGDKEHQAGGTGLGLSISAKLVRLMSSSLKVESELRKGSRFWFDVDFPVAEQVRTAASADMAIFGYSGPRRRALVVDDSEINRHLLREQLQRLGFDVSEACDGLEALQAIDSGRPDVIFMDLRMPRMDGLEATKRIRAMEACHEIPIIAVSASTTAEVIAESIAAGATVFLPKPVMDYELIERLIPLLELDWVGHDAPEDARPNDGADDLVSPPQERLHLLLQAAKMGNMRQIVRQADEILALGSEYRAFAEKLKHLAAGFQSPAIMQMIEEHVQRRAA